MSMFMFRTASEIFSSQENQIPHSSFMLKTHAQYQAGMKFNHAENNSDPLFTVDNCCKPWGVGFHESACLLWYCSLVVSLSLKV